ncbi:MAG: hypothetical protein NUV77_08545 [Thermoguttaceae bacterium]|jgi:hypothetical protein|nr:hypothetical protein [Thermoguttaceae bacterium]
MDTQGVGFDMDFPTDTLSADETVVERTSVEYLGRWNRLVSTTNWEKGRIISQWRQSLLAAGVPIQFCSDEAWSRRVGHVSPQHVGRLRRTYEQFGEVYEQYPGLYWSHFQAALDWHDAEMWLEGAVQNGWSVAQMRRQRWQTLGAAAEAEPREDEIVVAELDEDSALDETPREIAEEPIREVRDPDAAQGAERLGDRPAETASLDEASEPLVECERPVRPFENLPALPDDLHEAFETLKLAILHHKVSGWREVPRNDVLAALDALKALAMAPADGT